MKPLCSIAKNLAVAVCIIAAAACAHHKIIPDKTLAAIFHDAFLTNAYIENQKFATDSLDIYSPIFEKYGYAVEDVQYTIGNFSKRKNARLGDVVEEAIKMLEAEGSFYEQEVVVLDSLDNIAQRAFRRKIYSDSLIRVSRLKDTDRLKITLSDIRTGEYKIEYDYIIDSLDDTSGRRSIFTFEREDSTSFGRQVQNIYNNKRVEHVSRTMTADTSARMLKINLYNFSKPVGVKHINHFGIKITDLSVVFTPDAATAVDSLYEQQLPVRIFFKDFFIQEEKERKN